MCSGCWEQGGSPTLDTPEVRAAAVAVEALYEHETGLGCVGGALHIVTDDFNVDDDDLECCRAHIGTIAAMPKYQAEYDNDVEILASFTAVEQAAFDALVKLTPAERLSALALQAGFWNPLPV